MREHENIIKSIIGKPHKHENILTSWCREDMITSVEEWAIAHGAWNYLFEFTFKSQTNLFLVTNVNMDKYYDNIYVVHFLIEYPKIGT